MTRPFNRLLAGAALVLAATALAAGCGGSDEAGGTTTDTETTATAPTSDLRVALVADAGQLNDNGFNELAYKGLKRAERVLGVQGRVVEASLLRTGTYVLGWDLGIQMTLGKVAGAEPRHRNQAPPAAARVRPPAAPSGRARTPTPVPRPRPRTGPPGSRGPGRAARNRRRAPPGPARRCRPAAAPRRR